MKKYLLILLLAASAMGAVRQDRFWVPPDIDTTFIDLYNRNKTTITLGLVVTETTLTTGWKTVVMADTTNWRIIARSHYTGDADGNYYTIYAQNHDYTTYNVMATASLSGTGSDPFYVYVCDTATVSFIPNTYVYLYTLGGVKTCLARTNTAGYATFNLTAGDSMTMLASSAGYSFGTNDTMVASSGKSDTIYGTAFAIAPSSSPYTCVVYGIVRDVNGMIVKNGTVTAELSSPIKNTCDSTFYIATSKSVRTNSSGVFQIELTYSACLNDAKYMLNIGGRKKSITVPSQSTYQVF